MTRVFRQRGAGPRAALWLAVFGIFLLAVAAKCDERIQLFPRLHGGETLQLRKPCAPESLRENQK